MMRSILRQRFTTTATYFAFKDSQDVIAYHDPISLVVKRSFQIKKTVTNYGLYDAHVNMVYSFLKLNTDGLLYFGFANELIAGMITHKIIGSEHIHDVFGKYVHTQCIIAKGEPYVPIQ